MEGVHEVPQTLKQNVKFMYNFNVFLYKIYDLMSIRAGLGEHIVQTHNTKFFEDSMGAGGFEPPNPLWVSQWLQTTRIILQILAPASVCKNYSIHYDLILRLQKKQFRKNCSTQLPLYSLKRLGLIKNVEKHPLRQNQIR